LHWLHTGCQWKSLKRVIEKNKDGKPEIHYSSLFRWYQKWCNDGSWQALFESTVAKLSLSDKLDLSVLHGDGTTTAAKKGGDNIAHSGHKHFKGEKLWRSAIGIAILSRLLLKHPVIGMSHHFFLSHLMN